MGVPSTTFHRSPTEYWAEKIAKNRDRDADTDRRLIDEGWLPIRVWAHEDPQQAARIIAEIVRAGWGNPRSTRWMGPSRCAVRSLDSYADDGFRGSYGCGEIQAAAEHPLPG